MIHLKIEEEIKSAMEENKLIFGSKKTIKSIKLNKVKLVIISSNCPKSIKEDIVHNAKIANIDVREFEGKGVDLGAVCKKPFQVSTLGLSR